MSVFITFCKFVVKNSVTDDFLCLPQVRTQCRAWTVGAATRRPLAPWAPCRWACPRTCCPGNRSCCSLTCTGARTPTPHSHNRYLSVNVIIGWLTSSSHSTSWQTSVCSTSLCMCRRIKEMDTKQFLIFFWQANHLTLRVGLKGTFSPSWKFYFFFSPC